MLRIAAPRRPGDAMLKTVPPTLAALAVGAVGGLGFFALHLPLPWLLGSFAATLLTIPFIGFLSVDERLRRIVLPILGVLIGSSFEPEIMSQVSRWPAGVIVAGSFTVLGTVLGYLYLTQIARWDRATALYSAPPGGLAELVALAEEFHADQRKMILIHSIRIAIVVVLSTLTIRFYFDVDAVMLAQAGTSGSSSLALEDWLVLGACALVGGYLGVKLHLPGGAIFGALLLSAVVHLASLTHVSPPTWLVASSQIVLGASLGVKFRGITRREIGSVVSHGVIWGVCLLVLAFLVALTLAPLIDIDPRGLFLACAPGGFTEMLLVALAIGIEPAFVATCHAVRLVLIYLFVPIVGGFVGKAVTKLPEDG